VTVRPLSGPKLRGGHVGSSGSGGGWGAVDADGLASLLPRLELFGDDGSQGVGHLLELLLVRVVELVHLLGERPVYDVIAARVLGGCLMYHSDDFPQQRKLLVLGSGAGGRSVGFLSFFDGVWEFTCGVLTCRSLLSRYPSRPAWSHRGLLTHLAWVRCSRSIRHARRGLVAVISHAFAWAHCSGGIRHVRCGFFAALLTRLAWARCSRGIRHVPRGLFVAVLTGLAWARCSRGIRHARCGLFAALLTCLAWARCSCGICHIRRGLFAALLTRLVWARCSRGIHHVRRSLFVALLTRPAWARCSRRVVAAAPVTGIERWVCGER